MRNTWTMMTVAICAVALISGCSQDASEKYSKALMIDSYEQPINSKTVDFGSSSDTRIDVTAYSGSKKCGSKSLRIKYLLSEGGYMYCARGFGLDVNGAQWSGPAPEDIAWEDYTGFSLQVHGASRGGFIAFDVKDSGGELHRFLIEENFSGWKEIYVPFSSFASRTDWQPQNVTINKVVDFPIYSYQFEPKMAGEGQVYFDCLMLVKE